MTKATAETAPCKNRIIFCVRMSQNCKYAAVQYAYWSKNLLRHNMHRQRSIPKQDKKNQPLRFAFPRKTQNLVISRGLFELPNVLYKLTKVTRSTPRCHHPVYVRDDTTFILASIICSNKQSKIEVISHNRRSVRYKYMLSEIQIFSYNYSSFKHR